MNIDKQFITYQVQAPAPQAGFFSHAWTDTTEQHYLDAKAKGWPHRRLAIMPKFSVYVRRWTGGGASYHTVQICNEDEVVVLQISKVYGPGSDWLDTTLKLMQKRPDLFPGVAASSHLTTRFLREHMNVPYTVTDVPLKRDL